MRKGILVTILMLICLSSIVWGQGEEGYEYIPKFRVYTVDGVTFMSGELDSIRITADPPTTRELRRGRRQLQRFTRLRYNVHKVYPYAVKLAGILAEVQAEIDALPNEKARKEYVKNKEKSLFGSYEDDVRRMTRSQGKVLVKLIHRETRLSTYALIKDNKNGASALFWQSISLIFGINLKTQFDPQKEEEDSMIDFIVRDLEKGGYNIAYRQYNYQLK